jgi:ATP-dependent Zn protease
MAKSSGSIGEIRKKITKTHEFISTSYHEAGHTIYALLHLMRVGSVSVFENKKLKRVHGSTYYDYLSDLESIQDPELLNVLVRAEIGVSYAGLIAEKSLFKSISGSHQTPMFISDGSTEDNKVARELIQKYNLAPPGAKRSLYKKKLAREIQSELHANWDAVTLVAHALFKHRKLSFEDLRKLLTERSRHKKFWKEQFKKVNYFYDNSESLDENDLRSILSR